MGSRKGQRAHRGLGRELGGSPDLHIFLLFLLHQGSLLPRVGASGSAGRPLLPMGPLPSPSLVPTCFLSSGDS